MSKEILAITNYRVSSDEQLKNNSIAKQEKMCLDAVSKLGAKHYRAWSGSVSSTKGLNVDRKDLQEMLEECKRNRNIKYAVFDELDRFMRSMLEIGYFLIQFKQLGVQVKFASQPDLNADTATNTLLLMLEAYKAEVSNEERQRKSINGQTNALKEGRYTFAPKPGYMKGSLVGIPEIHPVRGVALQKVLLDIVYRRATPTQALINLNNSEFMSDGHSLYKMDKFRKIVTDPFYAGVVEINKQVQVRNLNGLHKPLISLEEHEELVRIMDAKKKTQKGPRKNGNPDFPISNLVTCELCLNKQYCRYVGYKHSNGKNSKLVYEKYRCRSCKRYLTRQELHKEIERQFTTNPLTSEGYADAIEALNTVWKREEGQAEKEAHRIRSMIKLLKSSVEEKVDALTDSKYANVHDEIMSSIAKKKQEVSELEGKLFDLQTTAENDEEEFLNFAYGFIENMGSNFLDPVLVSKENRLRCKQVVFPAGFYIDSTNKVYTPEISELYRLATMKKDAEASNNSHLVQHS